MYVYINIYIYIYMCVCVCVCLIIYACDAITHRYDRVQFLSDLILFLLKREVSGKCLKIRNK